VKEVTLAGEGQQVFMAAILVLHTGNAVVQVAAIEIPVMNRVHFFKSPAPPELYNSF